MKRNTGVLLALVLMPALASAADKDRYDVGEEVPGFTLKVLNGDESGEPYVSVDKYYGAEAKEQKKAIILTFFATYCEPCKREMPFLAAMYDAYKDKGLQILSVSIDKENDKVDFAKDLAKQNNVHFPVLTDRFNIVAKRYFISKLPCVYVINGEGKVSQVNIGYSGDVTKGLLEMIKGLIGESGNPTPDSVAKFLTADHGGGGGHGAPAEATATADKGGDKGGEAVATSDTGGEAGGDAAA